MENTILWDHVDSFDRFPKSVWFKLQWKKIGYQHCKIVNIYSYIDTITHGKYTKKFFIRGFPGSGKTWCMDYIFLYKMACALKAITTVIMDKHSIQLVGCHWHKIFCIPIENNMNTYIK